MCKCDDIKRGGVPLHQRAKTLGWVRRSVAGRTAQVVQDEVALVMSGMRLFRQQEGEEQPASSPIAAAVVGRGRNTPVAAAAVAAPSTHSSRPSGGQQLFHRHEVQVGTMLGKGAFSEVYEVVTIHHPDFWHMASMFIDDNHGTTTTPLSFRRTSQQEQHHRFVMKHLRADIVMEPSTFQRAAADLIIESQLLSRLSHPNIIRSWGWAASGAGSYASGRPDGFFIILDRVDEMLTDRMERWKNCCCREEDNMNPNKSRMMNSSKISSFSSSSSSTRSRPNLRQEILAEKLGYAQQIVNALEHLHSRDLVFRDLKPDNIGFRGNVVQLLDFGLCRELPEHHPVEDRVFDMSGVGTRRYLAPEVILGHGYNQKVDIYSWSMVLHEMLTLEKPFELYNRDMHMALVVEDNARPKLHSEWPKDLQLLLQDGWAAEPSNRPCIQKVQTRLRSIMDVIEGRLFAQTDRTLRLVFDLAGLFSSVPACASSSSNNELLDKGSGGGGGDAGTEQTESVISASWSFLSFPF